MTSYIPYILLAYWTCCFSYYCYVVNFVETIVDRDVYETLNEDQKQALHDLRSIIADRRGFLLLYGAIVFPFIAPFSVIGYLVKRCF